MARWVKWIIGIPVGLGAAFLLLVAWLLTNPRLPAAGSTWFEDYVRHDLAPDVQLDQIVSGGYVYALDGRDLWLRFQAKNLRFRSTDRQTMQAEPANYSPCSPQEAAQIKAWFWSTMAKHHSPLAWLGIVNDPPPVDQQSLDNPDQLRCYTLGEIGNEDSKYPTKAGRWLLINSQTQVYYWRYANYD